MKKLLILMPLLLIMLLATGCYNFTAQQNSPYNETRFLMDTIIEITAYGPESEAAVKAAFDEFSRIQSFSDRYNPDSQLSKVNQMAGIAPVTVDKELIQIIAEAIKISEETDGAFDVSIGALTELWGIGHKGEYVPTQEEINKALTLVDYKSIQLDTANNTVFLPRAGMRLDLGGIAKDYALNKAAEILKAKGIKSALINAGGDIQTIGPKPDGTPWRIGVQDPRSTDKVIAKVTLTHWNTLQTSGDYQRFFIKDGIRYFHILDPKTGRQPKEIASVTLIYDDSVYRNEAIATSGFLVMGLENGLKELSKYPGVEAIFVTTEGKVVVTPGLNKDVEL